MPSLALRVISLSPSENLLSLAYEPQSEHNCKKVGFVAKLSLKKKSDSSEKRTSNGIVLDE